MLVVAIMGQLCTLVFSQHRSMPVDKLKANRLAERGPLLWKIYDLAVANESLEHEDGMAAGAQGGISLGHDNGGSFPERSPGVVADVAWSRSIAIM